MKLRITAYLLALCLVLPTTSCSATDNEQPGGSGPDKPDQPDISQPSGELFVKRQGENCYISAKLTDQTDIVYWFKKCLFNELYTFYRVGVVSNSRPTPTKVPNAEPELTLNLAFSDNVGPFSVSGGGWCGANHSYKEGNKVRTAYNETFAIKVNGMRFDSGMETYTDEVEISVQNVIYDPTRPAKDASGQEVLRDPLCRESVTYLIRRNSIEVAASHEFCNVSPVTVVAYYGMQSMFKDETHTFTSGGEYTDWSVLNDSRFTKQDYPAFRRFVERNASAYQSTFLLPDGLGDHARIAANNAIFIGSSYGKSYHWLIANKQLKNGDKINWRGVYTWFTEPIADDAELLCYDGVVDGRTALFIDSKGACDRELELSDDFDVRNFEVFDTNNGIQVTAEGAHRLKIKATQASGCVLLLKKAAESGK